MAATTRWRRSDISRDRSMPAKWYRLIVDLKQLHDAAPHMGFGNVWGLINREEYDEARDLVDHYIEHYEVKLTNQY